MSVIVDGKEMKGPVYLADDGSITNDPSKIGVAATTLEGEKP
jgi:hypothetical protein